MHKQIIGFSALFVVLALTAAYGSFALGNAEHAGALQTHGVFLGELLLTLFGAFLSIAIGLVIVNVLLDKKSRKIAAGPLMQLIASPVTRYHNDLFIQLGRDHFGITEFNRLMNSYVSSGGNPQVFSPQERGALSAMVEAKQPDILACIGDLDAKLSDLISVLGWSYDAQIIAAALICKKNISEFRALANPSSDEDRLKRVERYLDIDGSSAKVITTLAAIYEQKILSDD